MPLVDVRYSAGSLDDDQLARVAERITKAAIEAEGLPDTPLTRSIAVVTCHRLDRVYVGGQPSDAPRFHVTVQALAGAMDETARRRLIRAVTEAFREQSPASDERKGTNVWCIVNDLAATGFAVGGQVVSIDDVRAMTGAA